MVNRCERVLTSLREEARVLRALDDGAQYTLGLAPGGDGLWITGISPEYLSKLRALVDRVLREADGVLGGEA